MKIRVADDAHAYRITLNDPPLNILDLQMLGELRDALKSVRSDRHALILDAAGGKAFSAGTAVGDHLGDELEPMLSTFHECIRTLARLELVTVAFVRGMALGGGCELAMACDFVLATSESRFGQPEIKLGVFPPVAAYQLSRQVAPRKGLELMLTGEPIDAAAAAQLGMINAVVAADGFDRWMERLYRQSASSLRMAKKAFRIACADDFDEKLARAERLYLEELMATTDAAEGLNAFLEKRKPRWTNR